ncbi:MAG: UxaA family hydrolase, partial [Sphingomonadales bacterium]|nr:UxaA family hydrolase [Sphingomonadales bacterium]
MTANAVRIDPSDNVATLLADAAAGEAVATDGGAVTAAMAIPRGHKIALAPIAPGDAVIKYGFPIGRATAPIAAGEHVHSDKVATALTGQQAYAYAPTPRANLAPGDAIFQGYRRGDGRVGTRNEIWVLPTVGCVARTAERIAARAGAALTGKVDGVHAFMHPFGCSQLGEDLDGTRAILASLACHPNAGGVLILGLGCENNQIARLVETIPEWRRPAIRTLATQLAGDEVAEGVALVEELAAQAQCERSEATLADLVLGVKCGGSDGLSGLTANPLVGRMSDRVTASGGRVLVTEIPEIFGAEQMLMNRAADEEVFGRVVGVVNDFKQYFIDHG